MAAQNIDPFQSGLIFAVRDMLICVLRELRHHRIYGGAAVGDQFDLTNFVGDAIKHDGRLHRQYERIASKGHSTQYVAAAVDRAIANIVEHDVRSFVIYGEPQSGKTEMMIALTAALLDQGRKIVIILTNDNVQLLEQNLRRFQQSGLDPAAKKFVDILDSVHNLKEGEWVVFAKKNPNDLQKLLDKVGNVFGRVVIDDEADYASPNSKVNRNEQTRINGLIERLIGKDGTYIGVTATPARLDLNVTFGNDNEKWIDFPPHDAYTGQDVFFPTVQEDLENLRYQLNLMPDLHDDVAHLRAAVLSFMVNVAYLNYSGRRPGDYSMLVHTSGSKVDHSADATTINSIFGALSDSSHSKRNKYVKELWDIADERYPGSATELTQFVLRNIGQNNVVVMNSNSSAQQASYSKATDPSTLFTFAVGGNIVSRGVTFNNLLSMFFTRDTRHKIQQDTYIQRARMFGGRGDYLQWFELHIPRGLYADWQRCFVFHKLSLRRIREGFGAPTWLQDSRIQPAAAASVKRSAVQWQTGEMYWDKFAVTDDVRSLVGESRSGLSAAENLQELVGEANFPAHLIDFIRNFLPNGDDSVVVHVSQSIGDGYGTADSLDITREKGLMGTNQLERGAFPQAIHHIKLFTNNDGDGRIYYRYSPNPQDIRAASRNLGFISRVEV